jgi:MazG family protein
MRKEAMASDIQSLVKLIETVRRLRAPGGCPWDGAQTHQTLRPYLIEEAYEVLDVLDKITKPEDLKQDKIKSALKEELGDLLMQVLLHSAMTKEAGAFDIYDVAAQLDDKLIRRHPHVFGDVKAHDEESAFATWEKQKAKEKASNPEASILDGVPKGMPALQRASRVVEKVTKVGFQWKDLNGPLDKLDEEIAEFKREVKSGDKERLAEELGDVLFSICNIAHFLKLTPEDALRGTMARFESRFRYIEKKLKEQGKTPEQSNLEEMDRYWNEAKKNEKTREA